MIIKHEFNLVLIFKRRTRDARAFAALIVTCTGRGLSPVAGSFIFDSAWTGFDELSADLAHFESGRGPMDARFRVSSFSFT